MVVWLIVVLVRCPMIQQSSAEKTKMPNSKPKWFKYIYIECTLRLLTHVLFTESDDIRAIQIRDYCRKSPSRMQLPPSTPTSMISWMNPIKLKLVQQDQHWETTKIWCREGVPSSRGKLPYKFHILYTFIIHPTSFGIYGGQLFSIIYSLYLLDRFFFKTVEENSDNAINEELFNDNDILPLFDGKVMCFATSNALQSTHELGNDYTVALYAYANETVYRTKIPGRNISLRQFIDYLPKAGNFRYTHISFSYSIELFALRYANQSKLNCRILFFCRFFFKTVCEEIDGPIHEEIINDLDILPLFEGIIMGKVDSEWIPPGMPNNIEIIKNFVEHIRKYNTNLLTASKDFILYTNKHKTWNKFNQM